jgi:PhzF family phenazine biosynthesis protein
MELKVYQVDAFAEKEFGGNPAAVVPLETWLDDALMQQIAMEHNQPETVFFVREGDMYHIRWFTPTVEVDICGHATIASAYILYNILGYTGEQINFFSHRSGPLSVYKTGELLTLNFPTDTLNPVALDDQLKRCFQESPLEAYRGRNDYMVVFSNEEQIREMQPNWLQIATLQSRGLIVTAKGDEVDFVSRWFGPQSGINEDPVTGSAHTTLIPYWREKLGIDEMDALQVSARCGKLHCVYCGDRVLISGKARLYMTGTIYL